MIFFNVGVALYFITIMLNIHSNILMLYIRSYCQFVIHHGSHESLLGTSTAITSPLRRAGSILLGTRI